MDHVKDWYDPEENATHVYCSRESTILLYNLRKPLLSILETLEKQMGINCAIARHTTDMVGIPSFLVIVDPCGIEKELEDLFSWILELIDVDDCRFFIIGSYGFSVPYEVQPMIIESSGEINGDLLRQLIAQERQRCVWNLLKQENNEEKLMSLVRMGTGKGKRSV